MDILRYIISYLSRMVLLLLYIYIICSRLNYKVHTFRNFHQLNIFVRSLATGTAQLTYIIVELSCGFWGGGAALLYSTCSYRMCKIKKMRLYFNTNCNIILFAECILCGGLYLRNIIWITVVYRLINNGLEFRCVGINHTGHMTIYRC